MLVVGSVLIVAVAASVLWLGGADERRVNAACDTWLEHRDSLRTVITESDEAVGRAKAAHAPRTGEYFNDVDTTRAALRQWMTQNPRVLGSLDQNGGASQLERGAVSAFQHVQSGVTELQQLIDSGKPTELADWIPEVGARFQSVDDVCLAAARSS